MGYLHDVDEDGPDGRQRCKRCNRVRQIDADSGWCHDCLWSDEPHYPCCPDCGDKPNSL